MTESARQARREYEREWRERNREHVREYSREYQRKHPVTGEKRREYMAAYWEHVAARQDAGDPATNETN